jgi:hypothetical protein
MLLFLLEGRRGRAPTECLTRRHPGLRGELLRAPPRGFHPSGLIQPSIGDASRRSTASLESLPASPSAGSVLLPVPSEATDAPVPPPVQCNFAPHETTFLQLTAGRRYNNFSYDSFPCSVCGARPRPPQLISVSLDAEAHSYDINLAAADRPCFRHVRRSPCHRNGCPAFDGELGWSAKHAARAYHGDLWLRVFAPGIPSLHGTRAGAPGSSCSDLLRPRRSRAFPFLHLTTALADGFASVHPGLRFVIGVCALVTLLTPPAFVLAVLHHADVRRAFKPHDASNPPM